MNLPVLSSMKENACGCVEDDSALGHGCLCHATGFVQIIGRKYAVRLLTMIGEHGTLRFGDLKGAVTEMSSSTLSIRLTELEQVGLIHRHTYHETPPRVEYSLTKEGKRLRGEIFSLSKFALRQ